MYAQLGNIRFEGLKGFSSFEESFGVNYAQHERIKGKPRLEFVGDVLDTISFDMYLHVQFSDVESDIEEIRKAMINREILPLILGNGKLVGNFVIPSFTKSTSFTDNSGNLIEVTLSIELLESFNENSLTDAKKQAIASAFATSNRNSNVRSVLPPKFSPASVVVHDVQKIEASSKIVTNYTAAVESNPSTSSYYSGKIDISLDSITSVISKIQGTLTDSQDLQSLATSLPIALENINTRVQNMKAVLPISDIANFKILNSQLYGSILEAKTANVAISNQSVIRRK